MEERWAALVPTLHPSTEPGVIEARQRADVRAMVRTLRKLGDPVTVAAVSELTMLPEFNVMRAMGLYVRPTPTRKAKTNRMTLGTLR